MKQHWMIGIAALGCTSMALAQAGTPTPPAYTPVRWNEDYSYLKDPAARTDPFDAIKFIPLADDGSSYLSLGGQARYRYEWWNNVGFGAATQDENGFHLLRLMAHADVIVGEHLRGFVQIKSSLIEGRDGGPRAVVDEDEIDIEQAFVDVRMRADELALTARVGRQNLIFGQQRLISPLDWTNTRRTFDGAKLTAKLDRNATLDLFWAQPVAIDPESLNSTSDNQTIWGGYYTRSLPDLVETGPSSVEGYLFKLDRVPATFAEGTADEHRWTIGGRFVTSPKPWMFEMEAAYQFGEFGDGDISAWFIAMQASYTFVDLQFTPRVWTALDYASGDSDAGDGDLGTFNQLYPLAHAYYGYADLLGRQNAIDAHTGIELTLVKGARYAESITLFAEYHAFWRASDDDAIYAVGGGVARASGGSGSAFIGHEIDLLLRWKIDRHTDVLIGYSHFFTGEFIEDTGADGDVSFFYTQVQFTF